MARITSPNYAYLINSKTSHFFKGHQGIKQEDPLFVYPYISTIVILLESNLL